MGSEDILYHYQPLRGPNDIRLLRLFRGTPQSYSVVHFDLEEAPPYEAVSYVWGEQVRTQYVSLEDGQNLQVTASIAYALPHLARACQTNYLWIDQITIDQSDIEERNQQVKIMGRIYLQCSRCLVWLDDGETLDIESDLDLEWEEKAGKDLQKALQKFTIETIAVSDQPDLSRQPLARRHSTQKALSAEHYRVREHLLWFLEHPWFKRVWVYQEFLLAKHVVFLIGNFPLPMEHVRKVFKSGFPRSAAWFESFKNTFHLDPGRAVLFQRAPGFEFLLGAFQNRDNGPTVMSDLFYTRFADYEVMRFVDVLNTMAGSLAQSDHDHVYAFLGLAPFLSQHIHTNYTTPVEIAFTAMAAALVKETRSLDVIDALSLGDLSKSKLRLPSWVPDYTIRRSHTPILCHDNLFQAAGEGFGLPSSHRCEHFQKAFMTPGELRVAGKIIDSVSIKLSPFSRYQSEPHFEINPDRCPGHLPWESSTISRFLDELCNLGPDAITRRHKKALLRTLFMDGVQWASHTARNSGESLYRTGPVIIGRFSHHEKFDHVTSVLVDEEQPNLKHLPHQANVSLLHELSKVQYRRTVVWCENQRFAMGLDRIDRGDKIAILHGARVPFVLRPRRDGKYSLLGQCFYDGAMYGDLADSTDDAAEIFSIV